MGAAKPHRGAGMRSCSARRKVTEKDALVRWFDGPDGTSWPDWTGRSSGLGGAGVYTLPEADAVRDAVRRRRLHGDASLLLQRLVESGERVWGERLGLATRAGAAALGQTSVRERMRDGNALLLLVAEDAGAAGFEKLTLNAERKGTPVCVVAEGAHLGRVTGREYVSCALIEQVSFARDLIRWSGALAALDSSVVRRFALNAGKFQLESGRVNE